VFGKLTVQDNLRIVEARAPRYPGWSGGRARWCSGHGRPLADTGLYRHRDTIRAFIYGDLLELAMVLAGAGGAVPEPTAGCRPPSARHGAPARTVKQQACVAAADEHTWTWWAGPYSVLHYGS
jgi:hypothetical protein